MNRSLQIITKTVLLIALSAGCQDCNRSQISPNEEIHGTAMKYWGIPNIGNTCYMNAVLQIIARLYPDLFSHMDNSSGRYGQAIVEKITSEDRKEFVTQEEAKEFFDALIDSYNQGKPNEEQLRSRQQEDVAPVLDFLLNQGNIQKIEFYVNKKHPDGMYATTTEPDHATGQFIIVTTTPQVTSMDELVANTLHGNLVDSVNWGNAADNQVLQDRAIVGNKLRSKNLRELTNKILPVWVLRYCQKEGSDPNTASKITTSITTPFKLTIAADYLIEGDFYNSTLVGFIHHSGIGSIDHGHYTAYIKNKVGKWVEYNDENVSELSEAPLKKAQEAYLYFYQAD